MKSINHHLPHPVSAKFASLTKPPHPSPPRGEVRWGGICRAMTAVTLLLLTACSTQLKLTPQEFSDVKGWHQDDLTTFKPAFDKTCESFHKQPASRVFNKEINAGTAAQWQTLCTQFAALQTRAQMVQFFETNFTPHQVSSGSNPQGLFTGYYEASLKGSRTRHGPYQTPLYKIPRDKVKDKPYLTRAQITARPLQNADVLVWVDDPIDAFFVQIQGSGIVEMEDGTEMRIGFADKNGHEYHAIGRTLVDRNELEKDHVSMQSIRKWLADHPDQADEVMNTNKSYVFFREIKGEGPIGGHGVALTPLRSLAIDKEKIPYGVPVFLQTSDPKISRLFIAQDTGGAIKGNVRGDVFWGHGDYAEHMAGLMKSKGQYWVLLPNSIKISEGK